MNEQSKAITNFMYFGHNHPHDFIEKAWKNNKHVIGHLRDKFRQMYFKYDTMTFFRWYMELDDSNKEILNNYIIYNYLAFEHLRTNKRQQL